MTRALWLAAWAFGLVGAIAYLALWRELFVTATVLAALAVIAWGFRVHPDPDDWWTEESEDQARGESVMAYEFEADEWARANHQLSEMDRATTGIASRQSAGMCGDVDDVRYGGADYR
ncbi:hypothetical protein A5784_30810 [Mycobacterium sp. 852013-50091_SCH5140682]|uniref:microaggregate invasion protein 1 n=1 Tax=Mycobacterium sp. 852013-50091_SCH5140682 TaxID=1834109 RepID=UPI0007EBD959|nr:hypothetical protein [Mycobacterium sp. 852013-50091_SCH5140682]OBC14093.1 hypothetical protein A5784_30810 [Mycobacterium sp. 852013-50091_SCH5140682]